MPQLVLVQGDAAEDDFGDEVIQLDISRMPRAVHYAVWIEPIIDRVFSNTIEYSWAFTGLLSADLWEALLTQIDSLALKAAELNAAAVTDQPGPLVQQPHPYYHPDSIAAVLAHHMPLREILTNIGNGFATHLTQLIKRIAESYPALVYFFYSEQQGLDGDFAERTVEMQSATEGFLFHLTDIHCTGSDLHKQGQSTLILTFTQGDISHKLIYKPSSVEADARLFGDYNKVIPNLRTENDVSIAQLFNQHLQTLLEAGQAVESMLPTYFVLACHSTEFTAAHGFIQYLSHQPIFHFDLAAAVTACMEHAEFPHEKTPSDRSEYVRKNVQRQITTALQAFLAAADPETSDYILATDGEKRAYSYACGLLAAMTRLFGIGDLHRENLIASRKKPYPIDLEVSFQPQVTSIKYTDLFSEGWAGFNTFLFSSKNYELLEAEISLAVNMPENHSVYAQAADGSYKPYIFERENFLRGFEHMLQVAQALRRRLQEWFSAPWTQTFFVRAVPIATGVFKSLKNSALVAHFSQRLPLLEDTVARRWRFECEDWARALSHCAGKSYPIQTLIGCFPRQLYFSLATFCVVESSEFVLADARYNSVPIFYYRPAQLQLYSSTGRVITVNFDRVRGYNFPVQELNAHRDTYLRRIAQAQAGENPAATSYFAVLPLETIRNFINTFVIRTECDKAEEVVNVFYHQVAGRARDFVIPPQPEDSTDCGITCIIS